MLAMKGSPKGQFSILGKKPKYSKYAVKDKILVRFGKKGKKAPERRHVLIGKVVKTGKHSDSYKIQYKDPISKCQTTSWFSVEDMADLQNQKQERKKAITRHVCLL